MAGLTRAGGNIHDPAEQLITGEAVGLSVRPASLIVRAAGSIIDFFAYGLLLLSLVLAVTTLSGGLDKALVTALGTIAFVVSLVLVPMAVETLSHGKSPGRWALGVRIVRADGGAESLRHAFIRALVGVVELFMTFGGLAAVVALLDDRSRRLGDLLAGTYSQHERVPRIRSVAFAVPAELQQWSAGADVGRLPDRLARRIAAFLAQAAQMTPDSRAALAADLAAEASPYVWPVPETTPELLLAGIAALRRERDARTLDLQRARLEKLEPHLTGLPHGFPDR